MNDALNARKTGKRVRGDGSEAAGRGVVFFLPFVGFQWKCASWISPIRSMIVIISKRTDSCNAIDAGGEKQSRSHISSLMILLYSHVGHLS